MKTIEEIQTTLPNFTGTEHWYRWSPLFRTLLLTDGAKYIADSCDAYWLMDVIGSHLSSVKERMGHVILMRKSKSWHFEINDGDRGDGVKIYAKQKIEYSDFPLERIDMYLIYDGEHWVLMLPSEY